jgi:hypothetical protein
LALSTSANLGFLQIDADKGRFKAHLLDYALTWINDG